MGTDSFDQTLSYPTAVWTTAPYTDASPDSWYASAVRYTYDNGLMNGTGEYSFEAESSMTRAMLVTVLWRYAGQPQLLPTPLRMFRAASGTRRLSHGQRRTAWSTASAAVSLIRMAA